MFEKLGDVDRDTFHSELEKEDVLIKSEPEDDEELNAENTDIKNSFRFTYKLGLSTPSESGSELCGTLNKSTLKYVKIDNYRKTIQTNIDNPWSLVRKLDPKALKRTARTNSSDLELEEPISIIGKKIKGIESKPELFHTSAMNSTNETDAEAQKMHIVEDSHEKNKKVRLSKLLNSSVFFNSPTKRKSKKKDKSKLVSSSESSTDSDDVTFSDQIIEKQVEYIDKKPKSKTKHWKTNNLSNDDKMISDLLSAQIKDLLENIDDSELENEPRKLETTPAKYKKHNVFLVDQDSDDSSIGEPVFHETEAKHNISSLDIDVDELEKASARKLDESTIKISAHSTPFPEKRNETEKVFNSSKPKTGEKKKTKKQKLVKNTTENVENNNPQQKLEKQNMNEFARNESNEFESKQGKLVDYKANIYEKEQKRCRDEAHPENVRKMKKIKTLENKPISVKQEARKEIQAKNASKRSHLTSRQDSGTEVETGDELARINESVLQDAEKRLNEKKTDDCYILNESERNFLATAIQKSSKKPSSSVFNESLTEIKRKKKTIDALKKTESKRISIEVNKRQSKDENISGNKDEQSKSGSDFTEQKKMKSPKKKKQPSDVFIPNKSVAVTEINFSESDEDNSYTSDESTEKNERVVKKQVSDISSTELKQPKCNKSTNEHEKRRSNYENVSKKKKDSLEHQTEKDKNISKKKHDQSYLLNESTDSKKIKSPKKQEEKKYEKVKSAQVTKMQFSDSDEEIERKKKEQNEQKQNTSDSKLSTNEHEKRKSNDKNHLKKGKDPFKHQIEEDQNSLRQKHDQSHLLNVFSENKKMKSSKKHDDKVKAVPVTEINFSESDEDDSCTSDESPSEIERENTKLKEDENNSRNKQGESETDSIKTKKNKSPKKESEFFKPVSMIKYDKQFQVEEIKERKNTETPARKARKNKDPLHQEKEKKRKKSKRHNESILDFFTPKRPSDGNVNSSTQTNENEIGNKKTNSEAFKYTGENSTNSFEPFYEQLRENVRKRPIEDETKETVSKKRNDMESPVKKIKTEMTSTLNTPIKEHDAIISDYFNEEFDKELERILTEDESCTATICSAPKDLKIPNESLKNGQFRAEDETLWKIRSIEEIEEEIEQFGIQFEPDKEKLKNLDIALPWSLPLIHKIVHHVHTPSSAEKRDLKNAGIVLKAGKFTKDEDEKIKMKWLEFCKMHDWNIKNYRPFVTVTKVEAKKILNKQQTRRFALFLSSGFSDRCMASVIARFRKLFLRQDLSIKKFNSAEDEVLLKFMNNTKSKTPYADVAGILKRTRASVFNRYQLLCEKKHYGTGKIVKWDKELTEQLIVNLIETACLVNLKELESHVITPQEWRQVSENMRIPLKTLKQAWLNRLYPRFFTKGYSESRHEVFYKLIEILIKEYKDKDWRDIDWKHVAKCFDNEFKHYFLCSIFREKMKNVPPIKRESLPESLDFLKYYAKELLEMKPRDGMTFIQKILDETNNGTIMPKRKTLVDELSEDF